MNFAETLLHIVWTGIEFFVGTVIIKMIIGHWLADQTLKFSKVWFATSERKAIIWMHYNQRALKHGHQHGDVMDCHEGKCGTL